MSKKDSNKIDPSKDSNRNTKKSKSSFIRISFKDGPLTMDKRPTNTLQNNPIYNNKVNSKKFFPPKHPKTKGLSFMKKIYQKQMEKRSQYKVAKKKITSTMNRLLKCKRESFADGEGFLPEFDFDIDDVDDSDDEDNENIVFKKKPKSGVLKPRGAKFFGNSRIVRKSYQNNSFYVGEVDKNDKKHGKGKLIYTNGDYYDGIWKNDKRDGSCSCSYKNDKNLSFFSAYFENDKPKLNYLATLFYKNGDKYIGNIRMKNNESDEFGKCLEVVVREGLGELYWKKNPNTEKYYGGWLHNEMQGFGILLGKNNEYYYGEFRKGEKHGFGCMLFNDGSCYEGEMRNDKKFGKGTMKLCSGDVIEGNWRGDNIRNAVFTKGNVSKSPTCSTLILHENLFRLLEKDESFAHLDYVSFPENKQVGRKWKVFFRQKENLIKTEKKNMKNSSIYNFIKSEKEKFNKNNKDYDEFHHKSAITSITKYLCDSCSNNEGFLCQIVTEFRNYFNFRYSSINRSNSRTQHPCALDDVFSFISVLFKTMMDIMGDSSHIYGLKNLMGYLKKFVISKIYKFLFEIYKFKYYKDDAKFIFKLKSLSNITMQELGVKKKFIPKSALFTQPYFTALEKFREISKKTSSQDKFRVLINIQQELISSMDLNDKGADDTFPIYIYCFIKANIPNVYSEFRFMLDFQDKFVQNSEISYRFTVFENALNYISMLDNKVRDKENILITPSVLLERIEFSIEEIQKEIKKRNELPLNFQWLGAVLLKIANLYKLEKGQKVYLDEFFTDIDQCVKESKSFLPIIGLNLSNQKKKKKKEENKSRKRMSIWTELGQKVFSAKKKNFEDSQYTYVVIITHAYPSYVYHQLARNLEISLN